MWKPPINFIVLHYLYILSFGILAMIIVYPYGNLSAVDAYFFGVSASTESGLNPVDIKDLKLYQQIFVYITPIITNMGFINVIVVAVRLRWFRQLFKGVAIKPAIPGNDIQSPPATDRSFSHDLGVGLKGATTSQKPLSITKQDARLVPDLPSKGPSHITFAPEPRGGNVGNHTLYIPGPREREHGQPITAVSDDYSEDATDTLYTTAESGSTAYRKISHTLSLSRAPTIDRTMSSLLAFGRTISRASQDIIRPSKPMDLASLSPEELGGIEYRALRVLLKLTAGYFFGLHTFGVLCLVPWIHLADPKYKNYLRSQGQDGTKWAFYSSQTMVNNLGLTLTADSMITFRDATWPLLVMTFLAYAGNTFYPCFLRLLIWTVYKLSPATSSLRETLRFLLDHPRRCYTMLFPSTVTWALAAILVALNLIDIILIIVLDLHNVEVIALAPGPRVMAAIYQAASARHTGTSCFNLMNVNPGVQVSLMVMMYISIYPVSISMRMSGNYEDNTLGIYGVDKDLDEKKGGKNYLASHMRNQLSFDLWYIFLGLFCICVAESKRIMDREDYAFSVFAIFFEVVSAYGNVGLSLGYPTNLTSLSGHFNVFSKLVICAMMIRGRHRGLPYAIDRTIRLPSDWDKAGNDEEKKEGGKWRDGVVGGRKMRKAYTQ